MTFPFTALVGQEQLKTALLLNAVYPGIGGVLIRGEKGTAKSTAARALAALLPSIHAAPGCPFNCDPETPWPECPACSARCEKEEAVELPVPFVDLPLGATEDRVLGTLDIEKALREGRRALQPGLLATAHRGVLYIDEVNLLADHLVDVLLDAAAMGVNTVQREGVAVTHPSRFLLIGTMNPEEGDLRPQLLDRFGLMVVVSGPRDPGLRAEVVRRRLAFEADPAQFAADWEKDQAELRGRIVAARALLPRVVLTEELLQFITRLCCEFEVDGLRADIVLHKTARARSALEGRTEVGVDDVRAAAELVLPHRRRRRAFEQPGLERQQMDDLFEKLAPPEQTSAEPTEDGSTQTPAPSSAAERVLEAEPPARVRPIELAPASGRASPGRRNTMPDGSQGRYVRAVADEAPAELALDATLRAAVARGARLDGTGLLAIKTSDLHRKERVGRTGTLILFVVDASGSMAARQRMQAVKGAVLGLLQDAYEQRDEVGVIAFRGPQAELVLAPTRSAELAERTLRTLPTGGRTPLAHALVLARDTVRAVRSSSRERLVLLVLLSDGKANVALPGSDGDPWQQALQAAAGLAEEGVPTLVLDTDAGFVRTGRAQQLAGPLAAECLALEELSAEALLLKLRATQRMNNGEPRTENRE